MEGFYFKTDMFSEGDNQTRNANNKGILTGRCDGEFYEEGNPRGSTTRIEVVKATLYRAILRPIEEVFSILGISDDGKRTQHEDLGPAVEPVPMEIRIKRTLFRPPVKEIVIFESTDVSQNASD